MNNQDKSYKLFRIATRLFLFGLVVAIIKRLLSEKLQGIFDYLIALPILASGIVGFIGVVIAIKGYQNKTDTRKWLIAFCGNLIYAAFILLLIFAMLGDVSKIVH